MQLTRASVSANMICVKHGLDTADLSAFRQLDRDAARHRAWMPSAREGIV
jgi:hypothetical protein